MSRSTAETLLRLEREAWVLDGPDGTRRCALDGGALAAALDALQPPAPARGRPLRVQLADAWLRYLVVNWPPGLRTAGERVAFTLLVFTEGRASYISTASRPESVREIQHLLELWGHGQPDVPAHEVT